MGRNLASAVIATALVTSIAGWLIAGPELACADEGAADEPQSKEAARTLLEDGDRYLERGDRQRQRGRDRSAVLAYEQALEHYRKAYQLVPKASIFYAIAQAETKLGRYSDAVLHFQKVLVEVDNDALREEAAARIDEIMGAVGVLTLKIRPRGAEVSIDSKLLGQAPLERPVFLAPGDHLVTVTANGYSPYEASLTVEAGTEDEQFIELQRSTVVVRDPRPVSMSAVAPPPESVEPPRSAPWIVGSAVTALALVGTTVTGALAVASQQEVGELSFDDENRADAVRQRNTWLLSSLGLTALTVTAAGYTAYRYFWVYQTERVAYEKARAARALDTSVGFWVTPYLDARGGGLAVGGRF